MSPASLRPDGANENQAGARPTPPHTTGAGGHGTSAVAEAIEISSAINISEGRRENVIEFVAAAAGRSCFVVDVAADPDHNRSVITLMGTAGSVLEAVLGAAGEAIRNIDMNVHHGQHPRMGALDVVPFTPLGPSMDQAVTCAALCAQRLWQDLHLPSFFYEDSSPSAAELPWIRRHAFDHLLPDTGGPGPHPTAGACVVGARRALVAFNLNLESDDLPLARSIAARIRSGTSLQGLRALGLAMAGTGHAQVSVNITRTDRCTMWDVYTQVEALARAAGDGVASTELIGLAPRRALGTDDPNRLKLGQEPKITEDVVASLTAGRRSASRPR